MTPKKDALDVVAQVGSGIILGGMVLWLLHLVRTAFRNAEWPEPFDYDADED